MQFSKFVSNTRSPRSADQQQGKIQYQEYPILFQPHTESGYTYGLVKRNDSIISKRYNSFTALPVGLNNKENVYKVGKWETKNLIVKYTPAGYNYISITSARSAYNFIVINYVLSKQNAGNFKLSCTTVSNTKS